MITHFFRHAFLAFTTVALTGPGAAFADTSIVTGDSSLGPVLTNAQGMTLYTFDWDKAGGSSCSDECAAFWRPLMAPEGSVPETGYQLVARAEGTMQWAHGNKPLYLWTGDLAPGDVKGDHAGSVFHAARPSN